MVKLFFGPPGCGKSTHCAMQIAKNHKRGIKSFCNYKVGGSFLFDPQEDLGVYDLARGDICDVFIDEASIEFHARNFKSFSDVLVKFFKKNRHYNIRDIYIYSQGWDDIDKVIRILAVRLYVMKRITRHITSYRRISRNYGRIDKLSQQLIDGYGYVPLSTRFIWLPKYWNNFDSFEHEPLPVKDFEYTPTAKERKRQELSSFNSGAGDAPPPMAGGSPPTVPSI